MNKFHEDGTPRNKGCLCIKCLNKHKRDNKPISKEEVAYTMEISVIVPEDLKDIDLSFKVWFE